jgi:N-formylglutamate deformylase
MYFKVSKNKNSPTVCNVPHSGLLIPEEFKSDFAINEFELRDEVKYMADNYTDELYGELTYISSSIISTISRVVVDIERFEKDEDEPMSKVGMSALYTKTSEGKILRKINEENRNKLISLYKEYHDSFKDLVDESLRNNNITVIVDCHSFPSLPRIYEPDSSSNRPDICIGVDDYHTPKELAATLKNNFESIGYSVKINSPFSGSIVPIEYYNKDKRVVSVMIEVNRKVYMDEKMFLKKKDFTNISKTISRCVIKSLNEFVK